MPQAVCAPGTTRENWPQRREELVELFKTYEYGRRPELPYQVSAALTSRGSALDGAATRELYQVTVSTGRGAVNMELALVLPAGEAVVPTVLMLSNHDRREIPTSPRNMEVLDDLFQRAPKQWAEETKKMLASWTQGGSTGPELLDISTEDTQGYWAVHEIIASGRAAAAFYASQAQVDDAAQFPSGLSALFLDPGVPRGPDGWGTLGVWAFAASRMVDVLLRHPRVDGSRISVGGHSRGGKAALWCAVQDTRINGVLVNNSGCSGAAVSRGKRGEVIASINAFFPHWFCPNYKQFAWKEEEMPFDQHLLVAAMAPRLCCVTSGSQDLWSDPEAEWLGAKYAEAAWKLFGLEGLPENAPGPGETAYDGAIAYHKRDGGHDLTAWDWKQFLTFLDRHNG